MSALIGGFNAPRVASVFKGKYTFSFEASLLDRMNKTEISEYDQKIYNDEH